MRILDDAKEMKIEQSHHRQIEEIMSGMKCSKEFICYKSGFKQLCNTKDIGIEPYVECLEKKPAILQLRISFRFSTSLQMSHACLYCQGIQ
jgi:hypothetical protein